MAVARTGWRCVRPRSKRLPIQKLGFRVEVIIGKGLPIGCEQALRHRFSGDAIEAFVRCRRNVFIERRDRRRSILFEPFFVEGSVR